MDQVARGWLIYELTDSAFQLGLVRGIQAIPILLLSPLAGSTADRYSRKMQVLVAQLVDGLLYGVIALLIFTGQIQPWHVYVTAFGMSIVWTFQQPSRAAMVGDAVPLNQLTNAVGLNSIVFNVARSAGPALAGFLIAVYGTAGSYTAQAIFYLLATIWTVQLRSGQRPRARSHDGDPAHKESLGQSIIEGWKFSWRNEAVRASLLIVVFASLFIIPFMTLLPVFARDILKVGADGQGLLLSAMGVGALFSSVLLASFGDRLPRINLMLGGVTLYGIIIVAFAASPWFRTFTGVDGNRRHCPRHLPCPSANCDSNLLAFRLPRPDNGCFSYDPCGAVGRGDIHRRILIARWSAVGSGLDEHRRRAGRDRHIFGHAACPADPIERPSTHSDCQREVGLMLTG